MLLITSKKRYKKKTVVHPLQKLCVKSIDFCLYFSPIEVNLRLTVETPDHISSLYELLIFNINLNNNNIKRIFLSTLKMWQDNKNTIFKLNFNINLEFHTNLVLLN